MTTSRCLGCTCTAPTTTAVGTSVLLATGISHTQATLRSLCQELQLPPEVIAPGLLRVRTEDAADLIGQAWRALTAVESAEVRCLVTGEADLGTTEVLAGAMTAPSLATVGARQAHADLVPLFADETARFHAVYQPIVALSDRQVIGHEALLRATREDGSPVMPDELFPAADAAGWTHVLDRVGRTTALRDAGTWLGEDLLFINFIPTSIYRPEACLQTTEAAARKAEVSLEQVVFEVTEGHQVRDLDHLERVFAYYRDHGCRVALDDLGAGYSSLNMLVRLRPDIVKLDKDIVQGLPGAVSAATVKAIVGIVDAYGGLVLAECIETEEQAAAAQELGVSLGQGWLFGRPVPRQVAPAHVPSRRVSAA